MKNLLKVLVVLVLSLNYSCTTVESGNKGVKVSWGETDMSKVYGEGTYFGFSWVWNEMVEYNVKEHTVQKAFEFNDSKDMLTTIVVALDYRYDPNNVNKLHVNINDVGTKIITSLASAAKEVVPQYTAVDLNKSKRVEGERKLAEILEKELPEFFVEFRRVRFTDINIPEEVSELAKQTAVQIGKNQLAEKKEAEQASLAKAAVAKSKGLYESAQFDVKTKELMSRPAVLKLYEAETDRKWAEKGVSKYGSNNVFGANASVIKGLK